MDFFEQIDREVPPDPVPGDIDMGGIQRYMLSNMDKPEFQSVVSRIMNKLADGQREDVSGFNFASLTPEKDVTWRFTMVGRAMYCTGNWDEPRCMYNPYPEAAEPAAVLKWMLETANVRAADIAEKKLGHEFRGAKCLELAEQCRAAGVFAYTKKNRPCALDAFARAVELAERALREANNPAQRAAARRMMAVCLANRAGAYLANGPGMDAKEALRDAEKAAKADLTYVKAYHRQARAHEHLGDARKAREVLIRALQMPGMANE
ncbi:hypothetical protein OF83DRAFT_1178658 [Amylostereum chailletii]|nr:hypothetical protein OF83DRAFT_1178658 [Amylostereum chailletii]